MSREESRLKRLPSSSVPSMKDGLVEFLGLELETFEALVLELRLVARRLLDVLLLAMSARKSRTRAAVIIAAELEEANAVDAVAWPARLDSRWANGLATL
eukprot:1999470-Pleurochrysis_carterae.AAC.1